MFFSDFSKNFKVGCTQNIYGVKLEQQNTEFAEWEVSVI